MAKQPNIGVTDLLFLNNKSQMGFWGIGVMIPWGEKTIKIPFKKRHKNPRGENAKLR